MYANILLHENKGKFGKRGFNMEAYSPIRDRGREILIFQLWKGSNNRISFRHQSITRLINEFYIKRMLWIQYLGYQFSFLVFFLTLRKQCKPIFLKIHIIELFYSIWIIFSSGFKSEYFWKSFISTRFDFPFFFYYVLFCFVLWQGFCV